MTPPSPREETGTLHALSFERRLPQEDRAAFDRRWTFLLLEELNGIGDRWRLSLEDGESPEGEPLRDLRERCRMLLEVLSEEAEGAVTCAQEFLGTQLRVPEQAWGPALVIDRLDRDRKRAGRVLAAAPEEGRRPPLLPERVPTERSR